METPQPISLGTLAILPASADEVLLPTTADCTAFASAGTGAAAPWPSPSCRIVLVAEWWIEDAVDLGDRAAECDDVGAWVPMTSSEAGWSRPLANDGEAAVAVDAKELPLVVVRRGRGCRCPECRHCASAGSWKDRRFDRHPSAKLLSRSRRCGSRARLWRLGAGFRV
jgi:hypothetical protein